MSKDLNKYGVPVWFIEVMKTYDGFMSSTASETKGKKMKFKRRLYAELSTGFIDDIQEAMESTGFNLPENKWNRLLVVLREATNQGEVSDLAATDKESSND